jgi:hypothetical protein
LIIRHNTECCKLLPSWDSSNSRHMWSQTMNYLVCSMLCNIFPYGYHCCVKSEIETSAKCTSYIESRTLWNDSSDHNVT